MQFSENWLRTWVNPPLSSGQLAHALTMAGLEVEALEAVAPAFSGVVVAQVLSVEKHSGADRLNVCRVDTGQGEPLQIVCGAANVAAGVKVPCALVGAQLPGMAIKQAKVRGVESFGMLCSAKELGLAEESEGLWLLPADAPVGTDFRAYRELDDQLFTLKLTPNRADCLGMAGIAREVAAISGAVLAPFSVAQAAMQIQDTLPLSIEAADDCPLYCGRIVRGINAAAPTPEWMLRRLERSGVRAISAPVDITNYVMLELGQPLHAFDLAKLAGGIVVRHARAGEKLALLNEQTVELQPDVLVIADQDRPQALAGVMGGQDSAVTDATRDVFLESAFFAPQSVAGKARRYGFSTDSSHRFERGVDFAATRAALERATQLLLEICGGQAGPVSEVRGTLPQRAPVRLRPQRAMRVLGIALNSGEIAALLQRLRFEFTVEDGEFRVIPPSYRFDLAIEEDLIEELARIYGYDNIPAQPPRAAMAMLPAPETRRSKEALRAFLVGRDYQEVVTYSFVDAAWERDFCANAAPVALQNPIASQMGVMRSSLIGSLVDCLRANLNRRQARMRLFEISRCFRRGEAAQPEMLAGLVFGPAYPEQWGMPTRNADFYDVKGEIEALFAPADLRFEVCNHPALHPGRGAKVMIHGRPCGVIGELHPQWVQRYELPSAPVLFEIELAALLARHLPHFAEVSKFPPVRRDLAVVVDEAVAIQALLDAMRATAPACLSEVALFDVYRGKGIEQGKKSLAFRVLLQDTQKTLTDAEVETALAHLLATLREKFAAQLRS
ncbi:MAG: phenylalanine--tRNA ligase subunit beta [Pseudomonadota bacterium]